MSNTVIIAEIFLRTGTVFAAVLLTVWYVFARGRRPIALGLMTPAAWLAAFYALCVLMIGIVSLVGAGTSATGATGITAGAVSRTAGALIPFLAVVILFLTVRRRVEWLLLPLALLINTSLAFRSLGGDADELIVRLWSIKPYVLLLMGFLYLLMLVLLYLLGRRVRHVLKETDPA